MSMMTAWKVLGSASVCDSALRMEAKPAFHCESGSLLSLEDWPGLL